MRRSCIPRAARSRLFARRLLQDRDIHYNGQHIAVVVAETLEQADAAGALVRVQYRRDEPITSMDAVLGQAYAPKNFRNGERSPDSRRGDPDAAFDGAAVKVDATYITPIEHHNPMEPHATIARWEGNRLTVWTATQGISGAQQTLAGLFGIDKADVHVICPYVGGGFGCKGNTWPPATLAAMAAKVVGKPVKLAVTRAQMFTSNGYRPRTVQKLRFAADDQGHLVSMRHDGFSQMSQPVLGEFAEPVGLATEMLYACPNVAVTHRLVATNASLPTYMRAPGLSSGDFALESAIDELAVALKHGSAGVPAAQLHRTGSISEPALRQQGAPGVLSAGRRCVRLVTSIARTTLHARRQYADWLGRGDQHLSDASHAGGACMCASQPMGQRWYRWAHRISAPAPTR